METFVGDSIIIRLDTKITLHEDAELRILFQKPNGVEGYWDASITPGSPTKMQYETGASDLSMAGIWKLQAYMDLNDDIGHGKIVELTVLRPFNN